MTRETGFEQDLADWLEEGPFAAPDRAIDAAIAHARTHPRRRFARVGPWRWLMDRDTVSDATAVRPARRGWYAAIGVVAATGALILGLLAVGVIGSGGNRNEAPAVVPPNGPEATATVPSASATVSVTGSESCWSGGGTITLVGDVIEHRGESGGCTDTGSDPRASGSRTVHFDTDEQQDGSARSWGTTELTNDGGAWAGAWRGSYLPDQTGRISSFSVGSGGYAGLQYRLTVDIDAAGTMSVTGTIEPVGPVAIEGESTCATQDEGTSATPAVVPGGPIQTIRGLVLRCGSTASDPRASGRTIVTANIDIYADESASIWGTSVSDDPLGTWAGNWYGTVDAGYTTHHMTVTMYGSGGYAGYVYHVEHTSPDGMTTTFRGTISPAD